MKSVRRILTCIGSRWRCWLVGHHVLARGDIVLCKVAGNQYLHLIKAIQADRFQIGNNRGGINGWIGRRQIYGRLVRVEA